jgi:cysteinyl-tRNA synthetase
MHENFLTFKGEKVSKSKGGLFTISELEEKGFQPLSYRYFILSGHYRKPLDFSLNILQSSANSYFRLKNICEKIEDDKKINKKYIKEFKEAMDDDLNTPNALQVLWKLIRDEKAEGKYQTIKKMEEVFGLKLLEKEKLDIPTEVKKLAEERGNARKNKDWKKSDELRNKINKLGFIINDKPDGYEIKRETR